VVNFFGVDQKQYWPDKRSVHGGKDNSFGHFYAFLC
jgi:hypothetical protein